MINCFDQFKQFIFTDWFCCDVPDPAHLWIVRDDGGNDIGKGIRCQAAENRVRVTTDCSPFLAQEPLDQAMACTKLTADDGSPKGEGMFVIDLTKILGPAVQVVGIGEIILTVVSFLA